MVGLGTLINIGSIVIGSLIGLCLKKSLKENYKIILLHAIGLTTIVVGLSGAVESFLISLNKYIFIIVTMSLVLGAIIGTFLQLEKRLHNIGNYFEKKYPRNNSNFSQGFISASLIFCVGAMAIIGSINDGISGDYTILTLKAILDGITSMILASTLGWGVLFSIVPVLIYQGSITILAFFFEEFIPTDLRNQMAIIGNILILGVGLDLLEVKKIKTADMLPAILIPIIYNIIILLF